VLQTMTVRSILVLQSSACGDVSLSPASNSSFGDTNRFAWLRLQESSPIVCDLLLLPEVPTNNHSNHNDSRSQPRASFRERRKAVTQNQEQKVTKISLMQLNPCGMDNVLLFSNLQQQTNIDETFLLSLTSCHYEYHPRQQEHPENDTIVLLPIDPVPSTFSFSFLPQSDQEYFVYVLPKHEKKADPAPSAIANLAVQWDATETYRLFQDVHRSSSSSSSFALASLAVQQRCIHWPWWKLDNISLAEMDEEEFINERCEEGNSANTTTSTRDDPERSQKIWRGNTSSLPKQVHGSESSTVHLDGTANASNYSSDSGKQWTSHTSKLHHSSPSHSLHARIRQSNLRAPTSWIDSVSPPWTQQESNSCYSPDRSTEHLKWIQELQSIALQEEQHLTALLHCLAVGGMALIVAFLWLFRRVWNQLQDLEQPVPVRPTQFLVKDVAAESTLHAKLENLSPIAKSIDSDYESCTRTTPNNTNKSTRASPSRIRNWMQHPYRRECAGTLLCLSTLATVADDGTIETVSRYPTQRHDANTRESATQQQRSGPKSAVGTTVFGVVATEVGAHENTTNMKVPYREHASNSTTIAPVTPEHLSQSPRASPKAATTTHSDGDKSEVLCASKSSRHDFREANSFLLKLQAARCQQPKAKMSIAESQPNGLSRKINQGIRNDSRGTCDNQPKTTGKPVDNKTRADEPIQQGKDLYTTQTEEAPSSPTGTATSFSTKKKEAPSKATKTAPPSLANTSTVPKETTLGRLKLNKPTVGGIEGSKVASQLPTPKQALTTSPMTSLDVPEQVFTSITNPDELSPTSRYAKQWEASRYQRRKNKRPVGPRRMLPALSPPRLVPTLATPLVVAPRVSATKHETKVESNLETSDPTQLFSPYSSMLTGTKPEKAVKKQKKVKPLYISPFISPPIDVSTESADDTNGAPSPASTATSCDESFLEGYW
jgi:hypothetical protein